MQIRAGKPELIDCDRDLPKMVMDYLSVLPHVSYLGVGINYVFVLKDSSHDDIRKLFLQDGPWLEPREPGLIDRPMAQIRGVRTN